MKFSVLAVLLALTCGSFGKNDWTKACLNGACSYDIAESVKSMGGTIEISGTPSAISDITFAAGWHVTNCTDSTNNQTIRLVCADESMGCAHIFQNGAQDTIVRLPEDCGSGPFVRVANHWIPDDQSVPSTMALNLTKRTSSIPHVHILQIDDDFDKISGLHGNVSFEIRAQGDLRSGSKQRKRQNGSGFEAPSFSLPGNRLFVFLNDTALCPSFNSSFGPTPSNLTFLGDLRSLNTTFSMAISVNSRGTISPPSVTSLSFSVLSSTNASISAVLFVETTLQGTIGAIDVDLMQMTFPSFLIDGIVSINPSFSATVNAVGFAQLFSSFIPQLVYTYDINSLQINYPSNNPPPIINISTPSQPFSLSALPAQNANAQLAVTTIFELLVQVNAFTEFVDLSVSHSLEYDMGMNASPVEGNSEKVCFDLANKFSLKVANSGSFYQAFSEANSTTIFEKQNTILWACQTVPLGPSPPARREVSAFHRRDTFSCPPAGALPQNGGVAVQGFFP